MNCSLQAPTHAGTRLLAAHIQSLDPEAVQARERLERELGTDMARKLIFALAARHPVRRAA